MALPAIATTYTYDDLNHLISVTYDNGQEITYTYDAGGNLLSFQSTNESSSVYYHVYGDVLLNSLSKIGTTVGISGNNINYTGNYGSITDLVYGKVYVGDSSSDSSRVSYYFDVPGGTYTITATNGNQSATATITTNSTTTQDLSYGTYYMQGVSDIPFSSPALTTITVSGTIPALTVGGSVYNLNYLAVAGQDQNGGQYNISGAPVTWAIATGNSYASVSGSELTPLAAGAGTITATVNGVTSNPVSFTVNPAPPAPVLTTVTASGTIPALTVGSSSFNLNNLSVAGQDQNGGQFNISGAPVTWAIITGNSYASLSGSVMTPLAAGSGTITATVNGITSNPVSFTVNPSSPAPALTTVTVGGTIPALTLGSSSYNLNNLAVAGQDQSGSPFDISGAPVTWAIASGSSYASVSGSELTPLAAGSGTITATINGVTSNPVSFTVNPLISNHLVTAVTNSTGSQIILGFNQAMANPSGNAGQFNVIVSRAGANVAESISQVTLDNDNKKIDLGLTQPLLQGDTITISYTPGTVAAANGGILAAFSGQPVTNNAPVPASSGNVTVNNGQQEVAITGSNPITTPITVTVPAGVSNAALNVATLLLPAANGSPRQSTSQLPSLNISAAVNLSGSSDPVNVQFQIPQGTTVSVAAADNWDGTIHVPTVQDSSSVAVTPDTGNNATVSTVIEFGFGDVPLTFSQPVRILIPGQAGKDVGYSRNGVFTKIIKLMTEDSASGLGVNDQDGYIGLPNGDLVVWTRHFTRFVTYTQTAISSGGGGGGGGAPPQLTISTISLNDATAGQPYTATISTNGNGTAPYTFSDSSGALPNGLSLSSSTGVISGTPTTAGSYNFTVTVKDANNKTASQTFTPKVKASGATQPVQAGLTDISGHWAEKNIDRLVALGAITGYPDGSFKPDNSITRAEFAKVLIKVFKLEPKQGKAFDDTINHWAKDYIATASAYWIVSGYDENTFGPDDLITREQMAVMVVKAAKQSMVSGEISFADIADISAWAKSAVVTAVKNGIIKGYPDNTFNPQGNATRAEAVTVIVNAVKYNN